MMKSSVILVCAAIAVTLGAFLILASIPSSTNTTTFTVPAGNYYYRFETANLLNGKVSGTFEVTSGGNVTLMVFDRTEYESYVETGLATPMSTVSGETGSFYASLSGMGKLFIVFEHEAMSGFFASDVRIDYKVTGVAVTFLLIGIVLVAAGAVLGPIGLVLRKKEIHERPPSPVARDSQARKPPPNDTKK